MGFFNKIKQNLTHGGVKVVLRTPPQVSAADTAMNVQLDIVADQPQQINKITVKFIRSVLDKSPAGFSGDTQSPPSRNENTIGSYSYDVPFLLQPNAPVSMPVTVPFQLVAQLPGSGPGYDQVNSVLDKLQTANNFLDDKTCTYYVSAVIDVEGIALDPADRKDIQVSGVNELV